MAYFNPYFNPYQQYQQPQYQQQQGGGVNWVGSDAEAGAFLMAPNSAVTMWNTNGKTVYLKQTDATGRPSMKIYDLVERNLTAAPATQIPAGEFVTKEEFDALAARVAALCGKDDDGGKEE